MTIAPERHAGACASCGVHADQLLTVADLIRPDLPSTSTDWVCGVCYQLCAEVAARLGAARVLAAADSQAAAAVVVTQFFREQQKCICCGEPLD